KIPRPGVGPLVEEVATILERMGASVPRFDLVTSSSEFDLLDAARLREMLDVPGPRYEDALRVRDKVRMKQAVQRAGLRVPLHMLASRVFESGQRELPWKGRTVLKPIDGAASENVQEYPTAASASAALR